MTAAPKRLPRYPVYVPSKGRADKPLTIRMFQSVGIPIRIVVEPGQFDAYAPLLGQGDDLLVLPEDGRGLVYSRNWIKDHATAEGHARHWQFDDDIRYMVRTYRGYRLRCPANACLAIAEDFVDRYENVGAASFNSEFFIPVTDGKAMDANANRPPFYLNARCYTVFLIDNTLPLRFRHRYNEDADYSLQVLASGYCTMLFNAFLINTPETMSHQGGQTDIYVKDGRLRMARELERAWPGVVQTRKRFGRPQHAIKHRWRRFDVPLRRKEGITIPAQGNDEHGLHLVQQRAFTTSSPGLRKLLDAK